MLKKIIIPLIAQEPTDDAPRDIYKARLARHREKFNAQVESAEQELDIYLGAGFEVKHREVVETDAQILLYLYLHRLPFFNERLCTNALEKINKGEPQGKAHKTLDEAIQYAKIKADLDNEPQGLVILTYEGFDLIAIIEPPKKTGDYLTYDYDANDNKVFRIWENHYKRHSSPIDGALASSSRKIVASETLTKPFDYYEVIASRRDIVLVYDNRVVASYRLEDDKS